jgi:lantibiotic modifying enzyme
MPGFVGGRLRLDSAEREAARKLLSRLSPALVGPAPRDPSLEAGLAGLALCHSVLKTAVPGAGHAEAAKVALRRAIRALATRPLPPALFTGFVGVAWVAELVEGGPAARRGGDACEAIDEALELYLQHRPWKHPYDLTAGLVGVGVYALERLPRAAAVRVLNGVVTGLDDSSHRRRDGIAWRSDPAWLPPLDRPEPPMPWNLGLAHGIPGVIALLGRVVEQPVAKAIHPRARKLLRGSVEWLLAQRLPTGTGGHFPDAIGRGLPREPARVAWCYGDLGVSVALLTAARALGKPEWERTAIAIAVDAGRRPAHRTGVVNPWLCHGAAGVTLIFQRLAELTGDRRFAEAYHRWLARLFATSEEAIGGGTARRLGGKGHPRALRRGFLSGWAGVALVLAEALRPSPFRWDRALLVR